MKKELQNVLIEKYPELYTQTSLPMTETCMAFGIDVGDGWYDIVDRLSAELSAIGGIEAAQVKEKFGLLTYYIDIVGYDSKCDKEKLKTTYAIIKKYSDESATVCEYCGKPGKTRNMVWRKTLCNKCHKEYLEERGLKE